MKKLSRRALLAGAALSPLMPATSQAWFRGHIGIANHSRWVIDGDSISAGPFWIRWWLFAGLLSGGKLYIPPGGNTAIGGSTTTNVIARLATDEAYTPKVYSLMIGTNNIGPVIPDLQNTIYPGMLGVGSIINAIPIMPKRTGRSADQFAANVYIRGFIGNPHYIITDFENVFDPSLSASPLQTDDGLHPNVYGAYLIAAAWAQDMAPYLTGPSILPTTVTAENLCGNPLMTGTSGTTSGASGIVANSWSVYWQPTGSSACVASKGTLSTGQTAQVMTTSGTGNGFAILGQTITINGQAGDNFEAWCCLEWSGTGIVGALLHDGSQVVFYGGYAGAVGTPLYSPIIGGVLRSQPITLTGTTATISVQLLVQVDNGSSAVFKAGQFMIRKVPSGQ